ncbi:MAG: CAAX protease family protein [Actinobacteria bacterium 13_2_20CM_2_71_6]|nr:MAG: CAAX protease family protein [Actinobacteria bacterium 13_2_20CM_2_71_6]
MPCVEALSRRTLRDEVLLVLGVSLGASAVFALLDLVRSLTAAKPLNQQTQTLVQSAAPGRPWLDLTFQLAEIGFAVVPALLAVHLLRRDHDGPAVVLGLIPVRPRFDLTAGVALAALIGIPGLGLYLLARWGHLNITVVPAALPHVWWTVPVLVLVAVQNAVLEEIVVVGYLLTRLRQLGWQVPAMVAASALLRGSYHLYQGFGGFVGNAAMGVIFAVFFLRFRRIGPLILAHAVLDTVVFVGYALFAKHLAFLH